MLRTFFTELRTRNLLLYRLGWFHALLASATFILFLFDDRLVTGLNAWVKPMKFAISIAIYAWTFGWLLFYLPSKGKQKFISWGILICMAVEMSLIFLQAARGVRSHFNVQTGFDAAVFSTMGIFIIFNTLLNLYTLILFFSKKITLDPPMLMAWRAGLLLFFLGSISGGIMSAVLRHSMGVVDGGPGLPFLNWSTVGGDIRSAHFITLHGLQAIPLGALLFMRISKENARAFVIAFSLIYIGICYWLHWMAFSGIPVFSYY